MFSEPKTVLAGIAFPLALIPTASATIRRLRDADSATWITFGPALWIIGWPLLLYIDNMKFESPFFGDLYDAYAIVILFIGPIIFTATMPILLMMLSLAPPNTTPLSK